MQVVGQLEATAEPEADVVHVEEHRIDARVGHGVRIVARACEQLDRGLEPVARPGADPEGVVPLADRSNRDGAVRRARVVQAGALLGIAVAATLSELDDAVLVVLGDALVVDQAPALVIGEESQLHVRFDPGLDA